MRIAAGSSNTRRSDSRSRQLENAPSAGSNTGAAIGVTGPTSTPPGGLLALQRLTTRQTVAGQKDPMRSMPLPAPPTGLLGLQQLIASRPVVKREEKARSQPILPAARTAPKDAANAPVQRYQQGEEGHGALTETDLRQAGFGDDGGTQNSGLIGAVYFGNWLRDFSQVGTTRSPILLNLLNIIAVGEFGRMLNPEELGGYVPSEHADNPRGGGSAEDPNRPADRPASGAARLSETQKASIRESQTEEFQKMLETRAKASHLPAYIEASKAFVRREFARAADQGRSSEGALAFGSGLHTVQDYFSHSNFTDACLALLVKEGAVPKNSHPYLRLLHRARRLQYDPSGGIVRGAASPEIFSGTYRDVGNVNISRLETLVSEIKNGSLRRAAVVGAIRLGIQNGSELGASAGRSISGVLGGSLAAIGGGLVEGVKGAYQGVKEGYTLGRAFGPSEAAGAAVGLGVVGGARGAQRGLAQGYALGDAAAGKYGKSIGSAVGSAYGAAYAAEIIGGFVAALSVIIEDFRKTPYVNQALAYGAEAFNDSQLEKSIANDRQHGDTAPNHSQLSKDDTEHPLFELSTGLERVAGVSLANAMAEVWKVERAKRSTEELDKLLDQYVSHPSYSDWWREPLKALVSRRAAPTEE